MRLKILVDDVQAFLVDELVVTALCVEAASTYERTQSTRRRTACPVLRRSGTASTGEGPKTSYQKKSRWGVVARVVHLVLLD